MADWFWKVEQAGKVLAEGTHPDQREAAVAAANASKQADPTKGPVHTSVGQKE